MAKILSSCLPFRRPMRFGCWMPGKSNFPTCASRASAKLWMVQPLNCGIARASENSNSAGTRILKSLATVERVRMLQTIVTRSPNETHALGERWARGAKPGWIIGLVGDLGAGKTHLVKGIAEGLGITSRVQSPTFTLVHEYSAGRFPLYHLDLYRLEDEAAIRSAGLEQYL